MNNFKQQPTYRHDYVTSRQHMVHPWQQLLCTSRASQRRPSPTPILQRLATLLKANTWKGYTKPTHMRVWATPNARKVNTQYQTKPCTSRTASHGIRRKHMPVYFYAKENNTLWRIYWRHNIPCETWEESPGSRTGHCAKQRCHIAMTFVQHHACSLSNIAVASKTWAWNTHPLVINMSNTRFCTNALTLQYYSSISWVMLVFRIRRPTEYLLVTAVLTGTRRKHETSFYVHG
jgi:hypothetical protein